MNTRYLIIGAGPAGLYAAESIRAVDRQGEISMLTDELYPFYSRPGIAYLIIHMISEQQLIGRKPEFWREMRINLMTGTRAARIIPPMKQVVLTDGRTLDYDRLLIATGAGAVGADRFSGSDLDGVITFDTLEDAKDLMRRAKTARRAVVVGGGITAMEVVEGLAHLGVETHYLLRKDTLWSSILNPTESQIIENQMRAHGVNIHYREEIAEILGTNGRVTGVKLTGGDTMPVDMVGICIGVRPQLSLANNTGLDVDRGILVDEYLRSNLPGIFAAGDCAQIYDRWSGQYQLDCLWPTALASGRAAGLNMAGKAVPYRKGISFNAALLFGVHMTAIGQVGADLRHAADDDDERGRMEELSYISRGSSEVWTAFPGGGYTSAWAQEGTSTQRIVVRENAIVGALLLGNQDLADPLRDLIEHEVDIGAEKAAILQGGAAMNRAIMHIWQRSKNR